GVWREGARKDMVVARSPADRWRGRIYAVRYFLIFVSSGAAVAAIAFLHSRGGFPLVLGATALIALVFSVATAAIAVLVSGVERERLRVAQAAEGKRATAPAQRKGPGLHPGLVVCVLSGRIRSPCRPCRRPVRASAGSSSSAARPPSPRSWPAGPPRPPRP